MNYLIDTKSTGLIKEMRDRYREAQPLQQQFWYEANIDLKMTIGQQDYWNQLFTVNFRNQRTLQFNKLLRVKNMIGGYQRKNRHVMLADPVENSDNETADQLTACLYHIANYDDTYEKISETFDGSIITGLNLLSVWMDYRDDPENGEIRTTRIPYNSFIMDPYWREPDLSDCEWIWIRRYLSKEQILGMVPKGSRDEIEDLQAAQNQTTDGRFLYLPENRQMYNRNFFSYDEYWTKEYRDIKKIVDKRTGEVVNVPASWDKEKLKFFLQLTPDAKLIRTKKQTVKLHVLVNDRLIWEEVRPYGVDSLPFVPFLCYHYPEAEDYSYRYQGVVRNLRDAQIELNKRRNKFFDILDSQINSGIIVKEDALVDPEDAFLAGQGRVLYLKDTANIGDVQHIPPPQIPQSMFELSKMLEEDIMNIAGATEELFGEDDTSKSGFMMKLRMGAGLVSLGNVFDNLRRSQKILGKMMIELIQANWGAGKIRRILNKEPTQQFKDQNFQKYDCVVEEGLLTSTQRQMQFVQLLQLREMGIPVPSDILLDTSTLQNKNELIEAIQKVEEEQKKQQQMQLEQQMHYQALLTREVESKAQNNFAAAQERQGRTISNIGLYAERESEKAQNMAKAALDQVKAIKELQTMDDERLFKLATFVAQMQQAMKMQASDIEPRGIQMADLVGKDVDVAKQKTEMKTPKGETVEQTVEKEASPV